MDCKLILSHLFLLLTGLFARVLLDGRLQSLHLLVLFVVVDLPRFGRRRREHGGVGAQVAAREVALLCQANDHAFEVTVWGGEQIDRTLNVENFNLVINIVYNENIVFICRC